MRPEQRPSDDQLLTPREVARIFGVRAATIARWAREGRIAYQATPGGHRRYPRKAIQELLGDQDSESVPHHKEQWELDAARMYDQGWSIRQVADRFECGYGRMRRVLLRNTTLRIGGRVSAWPTVDGTRGDGANLDHHDSVRSDYVTHRSNSGPRRS